MPPKKTKTEKTELATGTLHLEWFPAYGVSVREMPHIKVVAPTYEQAMQYLALLGYNERRYNHTDYNMVFLNEPFEVE